MFTEVLTTNVTNDVTNNDVYGRYANVLMFGDITSVGTLSAHSIYPPAMATITDRSTCHTKAFFNAQTEPCDLGIVGL